MSNFNEENINLYEEEDSLDNSNEENSDDKIISFSKIHSDDFINIKEKIKPLKIILIGDADAGKTSFVHKLFDEDVNYNTPTIGVDYRPYIVTYNNIKIYTDLWDTAGQERYNAIITPYYRLINGALLFFDLNNLDSFENLNYWMNDIIYYIKTGIIYIIGNKSDLEHKVKKEDILKFIKENYKNYDIYYKEISIKNNIPNVKEIYTEFVINLFRKINKKKLIHNNTTIRLKLKNKNNNIKKCCKMN